MLHMRKRINFKQMVFSPLHPCQPLILQKTKVENDNSRQGPVQLIPKGWGNFHYNNADPKKEGKSRHIGFTSSDSTDGLLSSFLALLAENLFKFFNNFHSQKYLSLFRKNRDAVWFYQVSYKSKRFNNPRILRTFVQFSKFKEIDCKDKIASNILKLWSVLGKHMLKTIVLAQTFDTGCVRRQ